MKPRENALQANKNPTRTAIFAWCLYDWASSPFFVIVTTFIFATYFTKSVAENEIIGTYQWANATAIAGIIIALSSPLLGAIVDHYGHHKRWLFFFTWVCIISTGLLWFAYPSVNYVYFTLTCAAIGMIAIELAQVFYNSFLVYIAPKKYLGRISGWGWGVGFLGGIVALSIILILFVKANVFNLNKDTFEQIRICGPFVAVWFAIFSLPLFFLIPAPSEISNSLPYAVKAGTRELISTLKKLPQEKNILLYLVAHMLYADGLNTLFAFGGIFAATTFGMSFEEVLLFGISLNITAGLGAILLGWLDDYLGSKETIIISLICLIMLGFTILFLYDKYYFWIVALLIGIFVGPVQSASRSMMVRLIAEKETSTEMFGLYALSGRITAFVGPWIFGVLTLAFNSQRAGIASILVFYIVGALLMLPVKLANNSERL